MITETDSDFINDDFGESITYHHYNAVTKDYDNDATITANVYDNFPNQEEHPRTGGRFALAKLGLKAADIPNPHDNDRFTFHGYIWDMSPEGYEKSNVIIYANLIRSIEENA